MTQLFLDVLAMVFMLPGAWIILMNWLCFYIGVIQKKMAPSWTPLLGAFLLSTGIVIWLHRFSFYACLPFLFDYGSVPGLAYTAYFHIRRNLKGVD